MWRVPKGRLKSCAPSAVPAGLGGSYRLPPTLKHWAIFDHPSGMNSRLVPKKSNTAELIYFIMNQKFFALAAGAVLIAARTPSFAADPSERGFKKIFNSRDLSGWDGNPKIWSVKDGAITGQTTAENPAAGNTFLIWTNGTVADFELRCSFKLVPGDTHGFANSGVQYRSKVADPAKWVVH